MTFSLWGSSRNPERIFSKRFFRSAVNCRRPGRKEERSGWGWCWCDKED